MDKGWFTTRNWIITVIATTVLLAFTSVVISRSYIAHNALNLDESKRSADCRAQFFSSLKPVPPMVDVGLLEHVNFVCNQQIAAEDTLTDFGIRKSAFLNQQVETPVLLWMVVAITLSGVLLAAIQLVAAYRLACVGKAAFEQGGHLNIEHNKVSLGSSVTGLMILGISFAFFLVFVTKVYLITQVTSASGPPALMLPIQPASIPNARVAGLAPSSSMIPNEKAVPYTVPPGVQKAAANKLVPSRSAKSAERIPTAATSVVGTPQLSQH